MDAYTAPLLTDHGLSVEALESREWLASTHEVPALAAEAVGQGETAPGECLQVAAHQRVRLNHHDGDVCRAKRHGLTAGFELNYWALNHEPRARTTLTGPTPAFPSRGSRNKALSQTLSHPLPLVLELSR